MGTTYYYHVWVRSIQYRGQEALTYKYDRFLAKGTIVLIPLRKQRVIGIVVNATTVPKFPTKPIAFAYDLPPIPPATLQLAAWMQRYYPASIGAITSLLVPQSLPQVVLAEGEQAAPQLSENTQITHLTAEQRSALTIIQNPDTYLLHGRTGSGKTRIYVELAKQTLGEGRSVMVLSPEIGLTSQIAAVFNKTFGSRVIILHSRLTAKSRRESWLNILTATSPIIAVGPRSLLFTPMQNIGLLVVDESHDQAYKQEQAPHYHAVRVASQLSKIHNAIIVLGSATPTITDYYLAQHKGKAIIHLNKLAKTQAYTNSLDVVDLKNRSLFPRTPHLSLPLIEHMSESISKGRQTLLYLNRRGTARVALCENCGWQALCPNCDVTLTYHGDDHNLRCHTCGFKQATLLVCPACQHPSMTFRSFGTKTIVEEVRRVFPEARIMRFDADSVKTERLEDKYQQIVDGNVDVLVGTQILAKGLDLPLLSTLGVVLADSSLYMPDYTAHERTFQLLSQVIGRIGRGHIKGNAIIQTYQPDSILLKAAIHNDWNNFYHGEIIERQKYLFPPFCHLLKLTASRASGTSAEKAAFSLRKIILERFPSVIVDGPAPAFHEKVSGTYRWQLVIKARQRSTLLAIIEHLPKSGWSYDIDPNDLL